MVNLFNYQNHIKVILSHDNIVWLPNYISHASVSVDTNVKNITHIVTEYYYNITMPMIYNSDKTNTSKPSQPNKSY